MSSDIRIDPQNDIKIDPPPEGIKTAFDVPTRNGRQAVEGEGASNAVLGRRPPPAVYSKLPNADLVQVFGIKERQKPLHRLQ